MDVSLQHRSDSESTESSVFLELPSLEVITFFVNDTLYATPVSAVRYIEQDKRKTTRIELNQSLGAEVTTYQGKPVPIYDFAGLMGCEAEYLKNLKLLKLLKEFEKDHLAWLNQLEESIRSGAEFDLPRDPNLTKFGKWYNDYRADDELLADILLDFDGPHRHLHSLADTLLEEARQDKAAALGKIEDERNTTLIQLSNLFKAAQERVENITRPILIFIDTHSKMVAIRLNAISDITTYQESDFTSKQDVDDNRELQNLSFIAGYLENKGDEPPCVLLDWRLFKGANSSAQSPND
ncbi:chemotaxis protein CheW [Bermanella sp. R86510]|uniref:chemotaxis protein CheW n=1 Tax=unclassified Bermanella TaxID=2627862 RepID=UPI0037C62FBE